MSGEKKAELVFVTQNRGKFSEASSILSKHSIRLIMAAHSKVEIQSVSIQDVATYAAVEAYQHIRKPLLVEDTGLFIRSLKGFPGAFSSHVYSTIGIEGVLLLLKGKANRAASFETVLAYFDGKLLKTFVGKVEGVILKEPRGNMGFGFDPIFSPKTHYPKSFAEMPLEEKNTVSHRAHAFEKFAQWYTKSGP